MPHLREKLVELRDLPPEPAADVLAELEHGASAIE